MLQATDLTLCGLWLGIKMGSGGFDKFRIGIRDLGSLE